MFEPYQFSPGLQQSQSPAPVQRRTMQIDVDGEIVDFPWDGPGLPTKTAVRTWMQQRRLPDVQAPTPTLNNPLPSAAAPPAPAKSIFDTVSEIGSGAYDAVRGMAQTVAQTGREGANEVLAGNIPGAVSRVLSPIAGPLTELFGQGPQMVQQTARNIASGGQQPAMPQEEARNLALQNLGIPAPEIQKAYQEGNVPRMVGQGLGTLGMVLGPRQIGKAFQSRGLPRGTRTPIEPPGPVAPPVEPGPRAGTMEALYQKLATEDATPFKLDEQQPPQPTNNILATAQKSALPGMQDAAAKTEQIMNRVQQSTGGRLLDDAATSSMEIIRKSGEGGGPLARMLERGRLDADALGGRWKREAEAATADLTPEQIDMYVEARDTGNLPNDPMVMQALQRRATLDAEVVQRMQGSGAGFRTADGKIIPFKERTNYWPHIYPKGFFANKPKAIEALMKDGMSVEDAYKAIQNASRFGERIISPLNERQTNAPGFRRDLDADSMHLSNMAKRIVEAEQFGPLDIADQTSPMSQLMAKTNDPTRIREIVSKHLGRDLPDSTTKDWGAFSKGTMKVMTAVHLSQFALSNMSQLVTVPLRGNARAYASALKKVVTNFKEAKGEAEGTGALQTIHQDILREVGGENLFSRIYGMKTSETINRTVAALTGKGTAEQLFATVKKGPQHTKARARLENLLLEDIDKVVQQNALTPEQLARAGGRMSEITQGRAQGIDLPPLWSGHPSMDLLLLYKKYAFRQSKIITEAIKENPAKNIPLAIALYGSIGEVIGDAKAGIKGAVAEGSPQGAMDAIAMRGDSPLLEKLDKPTGKILGRVVANLSQAWALGLMADAMGAATSGKYGMYQFGAGPVIGDATDVFDATSELAQGNLDPWKKKGASIVPIIGTGLAQRVGAPTRKSPFALPAPTGTRFGLPGTRR